VGHTLPRSATSNSVIKVAKQTTTPPRISATGRTHRSPTASTKGANARGFCPPGREGNPVRGVRSAANELRQLHGAPWRRAPARLKRRAPRQYGRPAGGVMGRSLGRKMQVESLSQRVPRGHAQGVCCLAWLIRSQMRSDFFCLPLERLNEVIEVGAHLASQSILAMAE
jgi:hypothetical protein